MVRRTTVTQSTSPQAQAPVQDNNVLSLPEDKIGVAEQLLNLLTTFNGHCWHGRPGKLDSSGKWIALTKADNKAIKERTHNFELLQPGIFKPSVVKAYTAIFELYQLNKELVARFGSYILNKTDWKDMRVLLAAFLLVQGKKGEMLELDGEKIQDYDYRETGEAMLKFYSKEDRDKMFSPKMIARVKEVLSLPEIISLNRNVAQFGTKNTTKEFLGRYKSAVKDWLEFRELNLPLLDGLVKNGLKDTVITLSKIAQYKPKSKLYFEKLRWKQTTGKGHLYRNIGITDLVIAKANTFEGMRESDICKCIVKDKMTYKTVMGMLPSSIGLTPAILAAVVETGTLSPKDWQILSPSLETFGLLEDRGIKSQWEENIIPLSYNQRGETIKKGVASAELRRKLEKSSENAAARSVDKVIEDNDIFAFLIDQSGSMEDSIAAACLAIKQFITAYPKERCMITTFNSTGYIHTPKAWTKAGIELMLQNIKANGTTSYGSGIITMAQQPGYREWIKRKQMVLIITGDEEGESGSSFARSIRNNIGDALKGIVFIPTRHTMTARGNDYLGSTVRDAVTELKCAYQEIKPEELNDSYHLKNVLQGITKGVTGLLSSVLSEPLLVKPY